MSVLSLSLSLSLSLQKIKTNTDKCSRLVLYWIWHAYDICVLTWEGSKEKGISCVDHVVWSCTGFVSETTRSFCLSPSSTPGLILFSFPPCGIWLYFIQLMIVVDTNTHLEIVGIRYVHEYNYTWGHTMYRCYTWGHNFSSIKFVFSLIESDILNSLFVRFSNWNSYISNRSISISSIANR